MAKPKEKELSALELMIAHADSVEPYVAGMPKPRRRRKPDPVYIDDDDLIEDGDVVYVGPGSRAKNREARAARTEREKTRQIDINVNHAPQPRTITPPRPQEVESALEDLFIAGERSGDDIVKAIKDGNAVSAKTQQAIEDWLAWEKSEAFKAKNRAKTDPNGDQPGAPVSDIVPANDDDNDDGGSDDGGGPDRRGRRRKKRRRGRRYGRNRGGRGGRGGPRPRSRWAGLRKFGKVGRLASLALVAGGSLAAGLWMKDQAQEEEEEENSENAGVGTPDAPAPKAVEQQQVQRAEDTAKETIANDTPKAPSALQDAAVDGASVLLMGATKRIPVVGSALGNGLELANDYQHINADTTMTDAEKERAKSRAKGGAIGGTAGGTTGAIAGAWVGGILGSVVPVAGTAAGAALGATIGGILGDYFGSSIGEYVSDKITDESDKMLTDGEKDRQEKIEDYNDTTLENLNKTNNTPPTVMPFNMGGMFAGIAGGMTGVGMGAPGYPGPFRAQPARRLDSKQVTDIANKAISEGGLGSVSEQFESGGRGVSTVSTGQGDAGGVSYGKHQLATNNGSMMNFLNSKEGQPFLDRFAGLAPGTAQFNSVYKDVASSQGEAFDKAQSDYITRTHYAPLVAKMQNDVGVDLSQRGAGVKELMYSTAVQYGAGTSVISNALKGKDVNAMSDEDLIKTIQDYKASTTDRYFKSSSAETQQSVAARAQNEKDVLLKVAEADKQKNSVNTEQTAKKPETEDEADRRIAERFPNLPKGESREYSGSLDGSELPDFTQRGPVAPKGSDADHERRIRELAHMEPEVNRIEPVEQPTPVVERQPLVTPGDIARQEAPDAAPVSAPAPAAEAPASGGAKAGAAPTHQNSRPGNAHSLDSIPVFMDDPMLNMLTMGYM